MNDAFWAVAVAERAVGAAVQCKRACTMRNLQHMSLGKMQDSRGFYGNSLDTSYLCT